MSNETRELIERLRTTADRDHDDPTTCRALKSLALQSADRISALLERVDALTEALKPFAEAAAYGERFLAAREADNLPHDYARAVDASAEQTGWNRWAEARALLKG